MAALAPSREQIIGTWKLDRSGVYIQFNEGGSYRMDQGLEGLEENTQDREVVLLRSLRSRHRRIFAVPWTQDESVAISSSLRPSMALSSAARAPVRRSSTSCLSR